MKASELIKQLKVAMRETETDPEVVILHTEDGKYGRQISIKEIATSKGGEFWIMPRLFQIKMTL